MLKINVPESEKKRVVIVGGGFAGLTLARKLVELKKYQVVLIDKNNYYQFQPLFYQVAMSGLEPSSIVFPFRRMFQKNKYVYIRITQVESINPEKKCLHTPLGICNYDYLVLATGAETNYFGNEELAEKVLSMKSVSEAIFLRNRILTDYENALSSTENSEKQSYLDTIIVGGGPTGVELAGALAEMRKFILPKDYPELNNENMDIWLIEGGKQLLNGMSEEAGNAAREFLEKLGVKVKLGLMVKEYDGESVTLSDQSKLKANKVIWAAGVKGSALPGLKESSYVKGNRLQVNRYSQVDGYDNIFVIGDLAFMTEEKYPNGHPQVAQVAMQQARNLGHNFKLMAEGKDNLRKFEYDDKGSMATVGRNKAVADLPKLKLQGFLAWVIWLMVHLFQILGAKNKVFITINWMWNYLTYDQSLRLIIRHKPPKVN